MGLDFASPQANLEITYHPFANLGSSIVSEDKHDNYSVGIEDQIKTKAMATKAEVDSYVFDPETITYQSLKYNFLNPFGYGSSNWYFDRAGLLFALRYYYGGMNFEDSASAVNDPLNLLVGQNFFPNGDRRYANKIIITTIANEVIAELTVGQANSLLDKRKRDDKEGYIPLWKRDVDEVYSLLSVEHDGQGFDWLVYPADIEAAVQQGAVDLQQKMTKAKREKIIAYVKWTYTLPKSIEALKILGFVLKFEGIPDTNPSLVANWARDIAEWKLANPNNAWQSYFTNSMKQSVPKKITYWPDLYFGTRLNAYGTTSVNAMAKAGFGYNFGESFIYATGYIGLPVDMSSLNYELSLYTNIRFVDFFELHSNIYYYNNGNIRGVIEPNFVIFDFLEIGGGLDVDVLPSVDSNVFGELFIGKCLGANIKYGLVSRTTTLTAIVKF